MIGAWGSFSRQAGGCDCFSGTNPAGSQFGGGALPNFWFNGWVNTMQNSFNRFRWMLSLYLLWVLVGCSLPDLPFLQTKPTPAGMLRPKFINATPPALKMDLKPFEEMGCKADLEGKLRCSPSQPPFDRIGCYEIIPVSPLLGGLKPSATLMQCLLEPQPDVQVPESEYLFNQAQGCLVPSYVRYVLYKDRQFTLLKNLSQLKATFAPIETPEEALSYAMTATGFRALYGLKDENMRYLVAEIADTNVKWVNGAYDVTLYSYNTCGCGPHAMNRRIVHVEPQGDVNADDPLPVWEDPTQDDVCVD